jgi:DNA-binding transcriptional MerR regulator
MMNNDMKRANGLEPLSLPHSSPSSIEFELGQLSFDEASLAGHASPPDFLYQQPDEEIELLGKNLPESQVEAGEDLLAQMEAIPQKMAFKIGEAADMVGVKQYVLRYWESEFDVLRPKKSKSNQRVYTRRDVETAMMIKKLLYDDRFSIEGARSALKQLRSQVREDKGNSAIARNRESSLARAENQMTHLLSEIRRVRSIFD